MRARWAASFCCASKIRISSVRRMNQRSIIEGLEWLGLDYDEEIVFQSNNADKHRAAANRLVAERKAYRDFTPREQHDDATVKQGIVNRARAHAAEGIDHRSNPFRHLSQEESD